jgi:hypothetical protein
MFPSMNAKEITGGNQGMKNNLGKYSLVISVGKYDVSILHIKLPMKIIVVNICQLTCR